jgi:hypothetical protein
MKSDWAVAVRAGSGAASSIEFVHVVASWAGNPGFEHLRSKFAMPYAIFTRFLEDLRRAKKKAMSLGTNSYSMFQPEACEINEAKEVWS